MISPPVSAELVDQKDKSSVSKPDADQHRVDVKDEFLETDVMETKAPSVDKERDVPTITTTPIAVQEEASVCLCESLQRFLGCKHLSVPEPPAPLEGAEFQKDLERKFLAACLRLAPSLRAHRPPTPPSPPLPFDFAEALIEVFLQQYRSVTAAKLVTAHICLSDVNTDVFIVGRI